MWKKWQLFCATDFQSLMHPCFVFCGVVGVFPYKMNNSIFEASKQRYILSTVIFCILCIYELVILYMINITGTITFKDTAKMYESNCFFILSYFIVIVTYISTSPRMHLLQAILNISSKLPLNSYRKLSRLIHTKDIFIFFLLVMQIMTYYSTLDFITFYKVLTPYIHLLVFQMDMLYINCVCVLKACFKTIDDNLINLREFIINDQYYLRNNYKHRNPFLLMELKALKKQHLATSNTVEMLNMTFSLHLLATIILTFTILIFHLYFYILHWRIGILMVNLDHLVFDVLSIIAMTYYTIKLVLIIWACETGKDQALKIGTTVHDLFNNSSDEQIKDELHRFSLQTLHCKNVFSAKGLIVDATLLTSIVSNTTTYLLILIQFMITSYLCNEKNNK